MDRKAKVRRKDTDLLPLSVLVASLGQPSKRTTFDLNGKLRVGLQQTNSWLKVAKCEFELPEYPCFIGRADETARYIAKDARLPVLKASSFWKGLQSELPVVGDTLRTLDLSGAALGATHALWVAKGLAKNPVLEVLDLSNNVLSEEGLRSIGRGLKSNSHLRSLYLSNVLEKGREDGSGFSSLFKRSPQHLRDLDVSRNLLKTKDVVVAMSAWLATNPSLETLNLAFTDVTPDIFAGLKTNSRLFSLCLDYCRNIEFSTMEEYLMLMSSRSPTFSLCGISLGNQLELTDEGFAALAACTAVTSLRFDNRGAGGKLTAQLCKSIVEGNLSLTALSLYNGQLSDDHVRCLIQGLENNRTLAKLDLGRNGFEADVIPRMIFDSRHALTALTALHLQSNHLIAAGAKWIASWLKENVHLTLLDLGACSIGDEGAKYLAEALVVNSSLRTLYLGYNDIGNDGCEFLGHALPKNASLSSLVLSHNAFSGSGAKAIAASLCSNKTLTLVDLSGNDVLAGGGVESLHAMLEVNTKLRELYFDHGNSAELNSLLERNFKLIGIARRSTLCFLACYQFRKAEFPLAPLLKSAISIIAQCMWATRGDKEWIPAMIKME